MNPRDETSRRKNVRLRSIAAAVLTASNLGFWSGCATPGNERAAETPTEERLRFLYPERESGTPTPAEQSKIERENYKKDKNR
jgi:hypothetical protein